MTTHFSSTGTRARAFQRLQEMFLYLQSSQQWQIQHLQDHAHDIEMALERERHDPCLNYQYQVTCESIHALVEDWCIEINSLEVEYHALFAPLSEQETEVFADAYEVATTLTRDMT